MEKKVTKKEMFETIIKMAQGETVEMEMAEIVEFAEKEIAALIHKAEKAKERAATKKAEDELMPIVEQALTSEPKTISEIAAAVSEVVGEEMSNSKIQYRLNKLAENGFAIKSEVVIPATEKSKKSTKKAYALA